MIKQKVISKKWVHKGYSYVVECLNCGKRFKISEARYKEKRGMYCSRKCVSEAKSVMAVCLVCKKKFKIGKTSYDKGEGKYCSRECRKKRIRRKCLNCGKEFETTVRRYNNGRGKYCSRRCYNEDHHIIKRCPICNEEFKVFKAEYTIGKGVYCSMKCRGIGEEGSRNIMWQGGKSFEPYSIEWTNKLKREIRKRDNYTCQMCGVIWNKKGKEFAVHHIDYDKKNCDKENLITLCHNCHSKTNANREYWKNYFKMCIKTDDDMIRTCE